MSNIVDLFVDEVSFGWRMLRDYIDAMETQLSTAERENFEKTRTFAYLGSAKPVELDWNVGEKIAHSMKFLNEYPRFLRYSFLILFFSSLESWLQGGCDELTQRRGFKLRAKDFKGSGIQQTKLFLKKVADIEVREDLWAPLHFTNAVRDCIVHASGDTRISKDQNFLEQSDGKIPGYSILEGKIRLEKEFATFVMASADSFFVEFFRIGGFGVGSMDWY